MQKNKWPHVTAPNRILYKQHCLLLRGGVADYSRAVAMTIYTSTLTIVPLWRSRAEMTQHPLCPASGRPQAPRETPIISYLAYKKYKQAGQAVIRYFIQSTWFHSKVFHCETARFLPRWDIFQQFQSLLRYGLNIVDRVVKTSSPSTILILCNDARFKPINRWDRFSAIPKPVAWRFLSYTGWSKCHRQALLLFWATIR